MLELASARGARSRWHRGLPHRTRAILGLLPVLLLLACPLSMVVMMVGMRGMGAQQGQDSTQTRAAAPLSREQQLAQLRAQLIGLGNQQTAGKRQLALPPVRPASEHAPRAARSCS